MSLKKNTWRAALGTLTLLSLPALPLMSWSPHAQAHEIKGQESAPRSVIRAYFRDINQARAIAHSRFETLESKYERGYVIVNASPSEMRELRALGFRLELDAKWQQRQQAQARAESQQRRQSLLRQGLSGPEAFAGIPEYSCYPTVEEVFAAGDALIAARPTLASWVDIGDSWEKTQGLGGYDLRVLKLGNQAGSRSQEGARNTKPKLFINAGIHAREYATTPLVLEFAKRLVNGYGVDADMTWILDHHEIHLLLATNPDGRKKAETGLLWRKNTNRNYCGATSNSRGADLNRNFGFDWFSTAAGSSGNACAETYRGPSGASEPETQAIEAYIRSLWKDRRGPNRNDAAPADTSGIHLDIHSHGRLLLWPWGSNGTPSANDTQLATLGRKFAFFNGHTPERSVSLYETDGTSDGPSYGELGVAAFTFELGTAFFEQCSYYNNTLLPSNLQALIYAAKVARTPYQTPAGPDALNVAVSGLASVGIAPGTPVQLSATLNDTRYNNSNGVEPSQAIAAAEYYVDIPPWQSRNVAQPMAPSDGTFDSSVEAARASIDTSGWKPGRHIVFVRGRDAAGNWGAFSAVFIHIDPQASTAPVAAFDFSAQERLASFTDRSLDNGQIVSRLWTFGDGQSSNLPNPSHEYAADGSYTVTLKVDDDEGKSASISKPVTVKADGIPVLVNGQVLTGLSGATNSWSYYKIKLAAGTTKLSVTSSGGSGDMDLYVQYGSAPDAGNNVCAGESNGNTESCQLNNPPAGFAYIGLFAYSAYSGVTLRVNTTP
ncbi:M14 family zinc carboxypeptidase [Paucibacter sp. Y2R2-4]|uniref:M14 family zinc carboxypeptidase n=1 Tax=Paucibacter sp. Y2R2-4 TaxID=2893553 RepID=UPI0021E385C4|nr:M14 family zinc carboxypeptidase [Paucibacter sp. Y2R2-4]MCV2350750.1 PKD domain-containing protein [Paucibacter sp. Y2R2-4]